MNSGQFLAWSDVPGATGYTVELKNGAGVHLASFSTIDNLISASELLAGRQVGNQFQARVRGEEPAGHGDWSALFSFSFDPLPAPQDLRAE